MKLLTLVPTRERPQNARRLLDSLEETTYDGDVKFCVDMDDPKRGIYEGLIPEDNLIVGPSMRLGPWLNTASWVLRDQYDIIGFVGDDVISRTLDWDDYIRNNFEKNAIMYPNDGWQGEGLPTSVWMDAKMIDRIGYMVYPKFTHLYIDNHWKVLGETLGTLKYLPQIDMEHMHPFAGKAATDGVYEAANHPDMYRKDFDEFSYWRIHILPEDVARARG